MLQADEAVAAVTAEEVRDAARRTFKRNRSIVATLVGIGLVLSGLILISLGARRRARST